MSFANRIFRLIEAEVGRNLTFSFSITDNFTRPEVTKLELGDVIRFDVHVQNRSSVTLHRVRGIVFPALVAKFQSQQFDIETLPAGKRLHVATISAEVVAKPRIGLSVDQIGTVSMSAQPDLSQVRFQESGRPLVYSRPFNYVGGELDPEPTEARPSFGARWGGGDGSRPLRSLPVSGAR